jgi:H+-transporting ATPase
VIITAIFESRKIFQRMRNYIIYRIACTMQLLFFFFFASIAVYPDHDYFYGAWRNPTTMKSSVGRRS